MGKDGFVPWDPWCVPLRLRKWEWTFKKTSRAMLPVGGWGKDFSGWTIYLIPISFGGFREMRHHAIVSCPEPHPMGLEVGRDEEMCCDPVLSPHFRPCPRRGFGLYSQRGHENWFPRQVTEDSERGTLHDSFP